MADVAADTLAFVSSGMGGKISFQEEFALPFLMEIIPQLQELGLVEADKAEIQATYPTVPDNAPNAGPTNLVGVDDLAILVGVYLGKKLADALVGDVLDDVYARVVTPTLRKLWARIHKDPAKPSLVRTTFDHWFDGSTVLVRVVFLDKPNARGPSQEVVHDVLLDAVQRLHGESATHRVMTYEVRDGVLAVEPVLSEPA